MSSVYDNDELRKAICAWLLANGLDPIAVPADAMVTVSDGQITTPVWLRNQAGHLELDPRTGDPVRNTVTVPLIVEPDPVVAEWVRPRCPTCGR